MPDKYICTDKIIVQITSVKLAQACPYQFIQLKIELLNFVQIIQ